MAQNTILLKRSALQGKVPDTGSLQLGEIAMNTYDGKLFLKRSGSIESIQTIVTTDSETTGSFNLSGSASITGSLTITDGITGSLFGTSSFAISASQALTASYAADANINTSSFATTGSNTFLGNQRITGSLNVSGVLSITSQDNFRNSIYTDGGIVAGRTGFLTNDGTGYTQLLHRESVSSGLTISRTGSLDRLYRDFSTNALYLRSVVDNIGVGSGSIYIEPATEDKLIIRASSADNGYFIDTDITGSLTVTGGITGSLFGTSSFAITASYASNVPETASFAVSASQAISSSYSNTATSSSYALTASYASNIPETASFAVSASNAISSSYALTASYASNVPETASYAISSSQAISSSYALNATSASHAPNSVSASYAATSSYASDFTVAGTLTAQTINVQTITSSIDYVTGSTIFGSQLSNTHQFTGSVTITGSLAINGTNAVLSNSGSTNHIPVFDSPNSLTTSSIYQSGGFSIIINQDNNTSAAPEALYVWQPSTSSYNVISGKGNLDSYLQLNIQNTNNGGNASSDVVATANNGNETSNFIDMGINGGNFTGPIGDANDAYLYSTGQHLHIGNATAGQYVGFFAGGDDVDTNMKLILDANDYHEMTGSLDISDRLIVQNGITGSLEGTASYAITASHAPNSVSSSYAFSASYAFSSSHASDADLLDGQHATYFATTGSNVFRGDQTVTGSLKTSGSNSLIGNTSLTGSLTISGSTTQIGNNTLLGNTSLSGSLTISGSFGSPTNPNIKIFGDLETNGTVKFLPVVTNIDPNQSGSYIYVSGTTDDLYFTQNSKGYANTTRLRWLEGNLYTGLLNGGLLSTVTGSTTFNLSSGSGIIVNLNASLSDNPYPTIQYINWSNFTNQSLTYLTSSIQTFLGIDSSGQIIQQTSPWNDGQYNTSISIGTVLHQNQATTNGSISYPNVAYGWKQRSYDFVKAFGPLKLSGYTLAASGSSTGSLVVGSGTAWADGRNYQTDPNNPSYITDPGTNVSKIFRYYQSGSGFVQDTNGGLGYLGIDPRYYNPDGTGVITAISPSTPWTNQRVFWYPNSVTKAFVVYYGTAEYASETEAINNLPYEQFIETPNTQQNAIYLGTITIKYNGSLQDAATSKILPGGLFRNVGGSGGGGSTVTTTLSGLSDVSISGPTNLQPLVYSTTAGKWINSSGISGSLYGNAQTATTASFTTTAISSSYANVATSASYALTSSFALNANLATTSSFALSASNAISASRAITASFALVATSASFATTAATASYVLNAISSSFATSASYALTSSFATNADSASYALNATSASYAATSSFASNFTIANHFTFDATFNDYATIASTISGTNNLFNQTTGSFTSAFFKYTVKNSTNARTGEVMAIWNGANVEFTDISTRDLGTTSPVTMSVSLVGANVQFNAITNTSGWSIKALATFM